MDEEERHEVEDTDADTRDVEETTDRDASVEVEETARDDAEVNRKLDAIVEGLGLLSKSIGELMTRGNASIVNHATPEQDPASSEYVPIEEMDFS